MVKFKRNQMKKISEIFVWCKEYVDMWIHHISSLDSMTFTCQEVNELVMSELDCLPVCICEWTSKGFHFIPTIFHVEIWTNLKW